jgi:hypothetical protein
MHIFIDTLDGAHRHRAVEASGVQPVDTGCRGGSRGGARTKTGASQMDEAEPDL